MGPEELAARIAQARASRNDRNGREPDDGNDAGIPSALSFGLSVGAQFMSAIVFGGGVGWAIDRWLGTAPFGILILLVLCFAAAMFNVWRSMNKALVAVTKTAEADDPPAQSK